MGIEVSQKRLSYPQKGGRPKTSKQIHRRWARTLDPHLSAGKKVEAREATIANVMVESEATSFRIDSAAPCPSPVARRASPALW